MNELKRLTLSDTKETQDLMELGPMQILIPLQITASDRGRSREFESHVDSSKSQHGRI